MKSKNPKREATELPTKSKVKIKNLKLAKETIESLSDQDAGAVKGGAMKRGFTITCECQPT